VPEDQTGGGDLDGKFLLCKGSHGDDIAGVVPVFGPVFLLTIEITDLHIEITSRFQKLFHDAQDSQGIGLGGKMLEDADGNYEIDGSRGNRRQKILGAFGRKVEVPEIAFRTCRRSRQDHIFSR